MADPRNQFGGVEQIALTEQSLDFVVVDASIQNLFRIGGHLRVSCLELGITRQIALPGGFYMTLFILLWSDYS
jgi:hypothetical protein